MESDDSVNRRRLLRLRGTAGAAVGLGGLAGCIGDGCNGDDCASFPDGPAKVAPIIFDAGSDGASTPGPPIPIFERVPFLTRIGLHLPAVDPPDGTVPIASTPRDGDGLRWELAVPNWTPDEHRITVTLPDYTQSRCGARVETH